VVTQAELMLMQERCILFPAVVWVAEVARSCHQAAIRLSVLCWQLWEVRTVDTAVCLSAQQFSQQLQPHCDLRSIALPCSLQQLTLHLVTSVIEGRCCITGYRTFPPPHSPLHISSMAATTLNITILLTLFLTLSLTLNWCHYFYIPSFPLIYWSWLWLEYVVQNVSHCYGICAAVMDRTKF